VALDGAGGWGRSAGRGGALDGEVAAADLGEGRWTGCGGSGTGEENPLASRVRDSSDAVGRILFHVVSTIPGEAATYISEK